MYPQRTFQLVMQHLTMNRYVSRSVRSLATRFAGNADLPQSLKIPAQTRPIRRFSHWGMPPQRASVTAAPRRQPASE